MDRESLTTAELIAFLKENPYMEIECRLLLGHKLGATHYWYWDPKAQCLMHTRDWHFTPVSEYDAVASYERCWWRIDQM